MPMGFFSPPSPYRSLSRAFGYFMCATFGAILLIFVAILVLVEITTTPRNYGWVLWGSLAAAGLSFGHVLREVYSLRPVSVRSWLVFAGAIAVLMLDVWITITDPTARAGLSIAAGVGGTMLFVARLLRPR